MTGRSRRNRPWQAPSKASFRRREGREAPPLYCRTCHVSGPYAGYAPSHARAHAPTTTPHTRTDGDCHRRRAGAPLASHPLRGQQAGQRRGRGDPTANVPACCPAAHCVPWHTAQSTRHCIAIATRRCACIGVDIRPPRDHMYSMRIHGMLMPRCRTQFAVKVPT